MSSDFPNEQPRHGLALLSLSKSLPENLTSALSADSISLTPGRWFGLPAFPTIVWAIVFKAILQPLFQHLLLFVRCDRPFSEM